MNTNTATAAAIPSVVIGTGRVVHVAYVNRDGGFRGSLCDPFAGPEKGRRVAKVDAAPTCARCAKATDRAAEVARIMADAVELDELRAEFPVDSVVRRIADGRVGIVVAHRGTYPGGEASVVVDMGRGADDEWSGFRSAWELVDDETASEWINAAADAERAAELATVRRLYGDAAAELVENGWTVDSALAHVEGTCDRVYCTADHDVEVAPVVEAPRFAVAQASIGAGKWFVTETVGGRVRVAGSLWGHSTEADARAELAELTAGAPTVVEVVEVEAPADKVDAAACVAAEDHVRSTRHTRADCPVVEAPRVAVYARVARLVVDNPGQSIDRQLDTVRESVEARGGVVVAEYADAGASGSNVDRPSFRKLVDAIEAGRLDAVAVASLDRLTRKPADLAPFLDLCVRHMVDVWVGSETVHPALGTDVRLALAVAAHESDARAIRAARAAR